MYIHIYVHKDVGMALVKRDPYDIYVFTHFVEILVYLYLEEQRKSESSCGLTIQCLAWILLSASSLSISKVPQNFCSENLRYIRFSNQIGIHFL